MLPRARDPEVLDAEILNESMAVGGVHTPNLPTNIIPNKIA